MGFQNPLALWGLALLAVPLYIHFFGFRLRKKAIFTRLDWLLQQQIPVQRRERLMRYLLLATRIIAVLTLVLALSGPIPSSQSGIASGDAVAHCMIYVDNSQGMSMEGLNGPLLEHAKASARRLIQSAKPNTRFVLMSNQSRPLHGGWLNRDRAMDLLGQIRISNQSRTIASVVMQMDRRLEQEGLMSKSGPSLWLFSDFRRGKMQGNYLSSRSKQNSRVNGVSLNLVPCRPATAFNAAIDSAWLLEPFLRPGVRNGMVVRTRFYGEWPDGLSIPMELRMSGQRKALATLNRPEFNASPSSESSSAGTSDGLRLDTLDFTVSNNVLGLVNLQIDEPYFTNDNRYYFSSPVRNAVSVLHLCDGRPNPFVQSVWKTDTFLEVRTASLREWPRLAVDSFSLVVLELKEQLQMGLITSLASWVRDGGGHLLILPVDEQSGNALGQLAQNLGSSLRPGPWKPVKAQMSNLEPGSDFLNNVIARKPDAGAMPSVEGYFPMPLLSGDEVLFKLENGDPLLKRFPWGQGMIYVSAVPAQERFTQWVRHDLFLPVFYRAALGSVRSGLLTGSLGNHVSWSLPIEATDGEALDWKLVARSMDDREMAQPMPNESNELSEGEQEGDPLEIRPEVRVLNGRICVRPGHAEIRPGFYDLVRQQGGTSNTVLAINANPEESDILPVDDDKLRALDPSILVSSGDQFVTHSGFQAGFFTGDGLKRLFLVACLVFLALEAVLLWQRKA